MPDFDRAGSSEPWVGGEAGGGVEVSRPIGLRARYPDLRVDGATVVEDGEDDALRAGDALRAPLDPRAEVGPDAVPDEHVAWQTAGASQPAAEGAALRLPAPRGARSEGHTPELPALM